MDQITNSDPSDEDPEAALRWLIEQMTPDTWVDIKSALSLIRKHGGFGSFRLIVKDGQVCDHPKVELSL